MVGRTALVKSTGSSKKRTQVSGEEASLQIFWPKAKCYRRAVFSLLKCEQIRGMIKKGRTAKMRHFFFFFQIYSRQIRLIPVHLLYRRGRQHEGIIREAAVGS